MNDTHVVTDRYVMLRVLVFRAADDPGTWIAQALEHNIAAHGVDIASAKIAFERTVSGYVQLAQKHHQEPLVTLRAASSVFWEAWRHVTQSKPTVQAEWLQGMDGLLLPAVTYDPLPAG